MNANVRKALEKIDLLAGLPPTFLDRLAAFSSIRPVRQGETIFCQGEPSPYCFGVMKGEVHIHRVSRDPRFPSKTLSVLGPGSLFGESCFFDESPRAAMASASRDGELVAILGARLREWIQKEPGAGVPLVLGLLQNSLGRLRRTSHELSMIYGVGRLLGSGRPFQERMSGTLEFLKGSLEGTDALLLYHRSPFWDEFETLCAVPEAEQAGPLPKDHALLGRAQKTPSPFTIDPAEDAALLDGIRLPWKETAAAAAVPLINPDEAGGPLHGLLLLASRHDRYAFSGETLLLLNAIANPLTETLSRYRREQDLQAKSRLDRSRESFPR